MNKNYLIGSAFAAGALLLSIILFFTLRSDSAEPQKMKPLTTNSQPPSANDNIEPSKNDNKKPVEASLAKVDVAEPKTEEDKSAESPVPIGSATIVQNVEIKEPNQAPLISSNKPEIEAANVSKITADHLPNQEKKDLVEEIKTGEDTPKESTTVVKVEVKDAPTVAELKKDAPMAVESTFGSNTFGKDALTPTESTLTATASAPPTGTSFISQIISSTGKSKASSSTKSVTDIKNHKKTVVDKKPVAPKPKKKVAKNGEVVSVDFLSLSEDDEDSKPTLINIKKTSKKRTSSKKQTNQTKNKKTKSPKKSATASKVFAFFKSSDGSLLGTKEYVFVKPNQLEVTVEPAVFQRISSLEIVFNNDAISYSVASFDSKPPTSLLCNVVDNRLVYQQPSKSANTKPNTFLIQIQNSP